MRLLMRTIPYALSPALMYVVLIVLPWELLDSHPLTKAIWLLFSIGQLALVLISIFAPIVLTEYLIYKFFPPPYAEECRECQEGDPETQALWNQCFADSFADIWEGQDEDEAWKNL